MFPASDVTFGDLEVFRHWRLDAEPAILLGIDVLGTAAALMVDYRRHEVRPRELPTRIKRTFRRSPDHRPGCIGR
jgi:hypothetical protein